MTASPRPPHPATLAQPRTALAGGATRPPHPATIAQPRAAFGQPAAPPPHPATVALGGELRTARALGPTRGAPASIQRAAEKGSAPKLKVAVWNIENVTYENLTKATKDATNLKSAILGLISKANVTFLIEVLNKPQEIIDLIVGLAKNQFGLAISGWYAHAGWGGDLGGRQEFYLCFWQTATVSCEGWYCLDGDGKGVAPVQLTKAGAGPATYGASRVPVWGVFKPKGSAGQLSLGVWHAPAPNKSPGMAWTVFAGALKDLVDVVVGDFNFVSTAAGVVSKGGTSAGGSAYDRAVYFNSTKVDALEKSLSASGMSDHQWVLFDVRK